LPPTPAGWHRSSADESAQQAAAVAARGRRIGQIRLLAFALFVLAAAWAVIPGAPYGWLSLIATGIAVAGFAVLVRRHRANRAAFAALDHRRIYHERAVRRIARDWGALPLPRVTDDLTTHPYATDLAITGPSSVLQLLDVASSAPGRPTLLGWLVGPPPTAATITERQAAVRELAARDDIRVELGVLAIGIGDLSPKTLERFFLWCESDGPLSERGALQWSGRAFTALIVAAMLLQAAGTLAQPWWLAAVVVARGFRVFARRLARESGAIPAISFAALGGHRAMLTAIAGTKFHAPRLEEMATRFREGGGAAVALRRVERIAAWAEVRQSPMLHFALDWLFLWDFHVGAAFDAWKRTSGRHVRGWLGALGEVEALAALSTLAYDEPLWTFPDVHDDEPVTVGPPGTFLLITGSNMSGKSTLLRALGVNCVLAQAGGPVCATRYRCHT